MNQQFFLIFMIIISLVLLLLDYYFCASWAKFVKKRGWNKWYSHTMWLIAGIMLVLTIWSMAQRSMTGMPRSNYERFFYYLRYAWYLPKVLIVPIMLIKDLVGYINYLIHKYKKKKVEEQGIVTDNIDPQLHSRRKLLQTIGWGMVSVPYLMIAHGIADTTYNFSVTYTEIPLNKLPYSLNGLRIVQISDIHAGSFNDPASLKEVIYIINNLTPDILVITGDFVNFYPEELSIIEELLTKTHAKYGKFGCLGNHDHYMSPEGTELLKQNIIASGIDLLVNENRTLIINGTKLQLAGCDNSSYNTNYADFSKTFAGLNSSEMTVLLCHDPTNWDRYVKKQTFADLTLSGHTHGGQIALSFFAKELSPARLVYKQYSGLYEDKDQFLYINDGLGTTGPPFRVGIPPEISLLILKKFDNLA